MSGTYKMFRASAARLVKQPLITGVLSKVWSDDDCTNVIIDGQQFQISGKMKNNIEAHLNNNVEVQLYKGKNKIKTLRSFNEEFVLFFSSSFFFPPLPQQNVNLLYNNPTNRVLESKANHLKNLSIAEAVLKRPECRYIDVDSLFGVCIVFSNLVVSFWLYTPHTK